MWEGWNPPRCTFLQPFTYVILFSTTESSQCDNRGAISSSGSRPCSCKVRARPAELIKRYIRTICIRFSFFFLSTRWRRWPERVLIRVPLIFLLPRTTWPALCATSARPASSTCQGGTQRAACSASAWASPGSAAAPLGAETRHVSQRSDASSLTDTTHC